VAGGELEKRRKILSKCERNGIEVHTCSKNVICNYNNEYTMKAKLKIKLLLSVQDIFKFEEKNIQKV
jgi:hypothetical protein